MRKLSAPGGITTIDLPQGQALLTVFDTLNARGFALAAQRLEDIALLAKFLPAQVGKTAPRDLTLKAIGPSKFIGAIENEIKKLGGTLAASVERPYGVSALFYTESGRLRLEKSGATQPLDSVPTASIASGKKTRVLVIDDSTTIQTILKTILESDGSCEVVGMIAQPSLAEEAVKRLKPDVITMDIHMPEMTGVELLKILHPKYAVPTVMITSVSREEGDVVMDALSSGAVDYIQKPSFSEIDRVRPLIIEKVKIAAQSVIRKSAPARTKKITAAGAMDSRKFIAIGSSTGGTEALREIFERLPAEIPPIVVVQHIPAVFSEALARRLNELCPFEVKEASDGDELRAGRVLIAPGGKQMKVVRSSNGTAKVHVYEGEPVNRHKPSVDVLFDSVSSELGSRAVGVILTGMGTDGAKGLVKMREAGSHTIAQNEESCVVFGMPREAIRLGGAADVAALDSIAEKLVSNLSLKKKVA